MVSINMELDVAKMIAELYKKGLKVSASLDEVLIKGEFIIAWQQVGEYRSRTIVTAKDEDELREILLKLSEGGY